MRFAAVKTIFEEAKINKKIYFLTGDLGHVYEKEFKTYLQDRYINAGTAEQNMVGVAAGLALSGMKVFVYSIVPFVTMRPFEQVKDDICYQNLDVTLIGVGGGLIYGPYGNTHCSIEDIAVMRVLPNMKIVCPANPSDTESLSQQIMKIKGPTYLRIGRGKEPMPSTIPQVIFGKGRVVKKGNDISIFCTGTILEEMEKAATELDKEGINTEVIHIHTVKPIDSKLIADRLKNRKAIFSVEDHSIYGGLGAAISEIISETPHHSILFKRFGVRDVYLKEIGSESYLRDKHGISCKKVVKEIIKTLQ